MGIAHSSNKHTTIGTPGIANTNKTVHKNTSTMIAMINARIQHTASADHTLRRSCVDLVPHVSSHTHYAVVVVIVVIAMSRR